MGANYTLSMPPATSGQPDFIVEPIVATLVGYDLFISYARADGSAYARALAEAFRGRGYRVFLDTREPIAGEPLSTALQRGLRRSRLLVLLASDRAFLSPHVEAEVRFWERLGRRWVPIDLDGAWMRAPSDAPLRVLGGDRIRHADTLARVPADETIARVEGVFSAIRARVRLAWGVLVLAALAVAFAAGAASLASRATRREELFQRAVSAEHDDEAMTALTELRLAGAPPDRLLEAVATRRSAESLDFREFLVGLATRARDGRIDDLVALVADLRTAMRPVTTPVGDLGALLATIDLAGAPGDAARSLRFRLVDDLRSRAGPPPQELPWVSIPKATRSVPCSDVGVPGCKFLATGASTEPPFGVRYTIALTGTRSVDLPAFRILRQPVDNATVRRLFPAHEPQALSESPAAGLDWYDAYAVAAWLGGRLPTETEWVVAVAGEMRVDCSSVDNAEAPTDPAPIGAVDVRPDLWEWTAEPFRMPADLVVLFDTPLRGLHGGDDASRFPDCPFGVRSLLAPSSSRPFVGLRVVDPG